MGCGASSPARLHPQPAAADAPITPNPTDAAGTTHHAHAVAPSTSPPVEPLSEQQDRLGSTLPPDTHTATDNHISLPAPQPTNAAAAPVPGSLAALPSLAVHLTDSARPAPSPAAGAPRFSLNQRPLSALHTASAATGAPSASATPPSQPRLSLAAFPMTDEAKAKLDRQRKRHTNTDPQPFPASAPAPPAASTQPPTPSAHQPARASLSGFKETPLSPSRSQRLFSAQRVEYEADVVDGVPAVPPSPKSLRRSRHASGVGGSGLGSEPSSATRLMSARSVSRRVLDLDGADGNSIAPVSTTASEADGSDSDRDAKDRLERRRTASTRGRFSQLHGARELTVPQHDRRLHNLSADSALLSSDDDDSGRPSLSQPGVHNADAPLAARPRLHLRTTSRDLQAIERSTSPNSASATAATAAIVEAPAAGERRESAVSMQRRTRRFTKTRHSNAFDGKEIAHRMSRYDSKGQSLNPSVSQYGDGWDMASPAGATDERRDSNHLQVREQPAMSSSSSSDESLSPVRLPRGHVRSVSSSTASMSSLAQNRERRRGAAGSSGSYNLAVPASDSDRTRRSSQPLAVQQSTPPLPQSSSAGPPLVTTSSSPSGTSSSPSAPLSLASPTSATSPASPASRSALSPHHPRHQSRGKHLALLYCPPLSGLLLSVSLHKLGYHVLTADSTIDAVDTVLGQRVDVLVVEWMDGEGAAVAGQVRAGEVGVAGGLDGEGGGVERTAVVVVCSEGADDEERVRVRAECAKAGCVGVMESGVAVLTALPELLRRGVADGDGCCWYVDGQSAITQIVAGS